MDMETDLHLIFRLILVDPGRSWCFHCRQAGQFADAARCYGEAAATEPPHATTFGGLCCNDLQFSKMLCIFIYESNRNIWLQKRNE